MNKKSKILVGAVIATVMLAAELLVLQTVAEAQFAAPAGPYRPDCSGAGPSCEAWTQFRRHHPYPYQTFAAKRLSEDSIAVIISEPAPALPRETLRELIETAFGDDLRALYSKRWMIGIDGWVEDLVLEVSFAPGAGRLDAATAAIESSDGGLEDLLADGRLRDRIALLHLALYGTTFGGDLELIGEDAGTPRRPASTNLEVTARELRQWLLDPELGWQPIDRATVPSRTWPEISGAGLSGAFSSADNQLVVLTFPVARLAEPGSRRQLLDALRADFRRFAVASDVVLGAMWERGGQAAIIARLRLNLLPVLPPLRFETFALLASQSSDELHQSYERNNTFAGKLTSEGYFLKDWAPIYLSAPLIDTELGALLNITDQMLKSWSEAGLIEYVYFDYPLKPESFAFDQSLSDFVMEESGGSSVLFNWNTSGSAAAVDFPGVTVLAATQTGALPVTYGSNLETDGEVETGHLIAYEKQAYDYFAGLNDPNLARVVQYTLIYQMFRAVAADAGGSPAAPEAPAADARRGSTELLVDETEKLLAKLGRGDEIRARIAGLRKQYSDLDDRRLAQILADPRSQQLATSPTLAKVARVEALIARHNTLVDEVREEIAAFNVKVESVNRIAEQALFPVPEAAHEALEQERRRIEGKEREIGRLAARVDTQQHELKGVWAAMELAEEIRPLLRRAAREQDWDIDSVFAAFLERNVAEPEQAIKTPSAVLSWDRGGIMWSVGGHNLNSRSLRFEPSAKVKGVELVETESGPVLRYNPSLADSVAEQATRLARAVEHGGLKDAARLQDIAGRPVSPRPRQQALDMPADGIAFGRDVRAAGAEAWSGWIGKRRYTQRADMVEDIRGLAEANDCCVFVARNQQQQAYVARRNLSPPPGSRVAEVRDTASLRAHLAEVSHGNGGKPVIFLGYSPAQVKALSTGLGVSTAPSVPSALKAMARWLGGGGSKGPPRPPRGATVAFPDPANRGSTLELLAFKKGKPVSPRQSLRSLLRQGEARRVTKVAEVEPAGVDAMLRNAGWNRQVDGLPAAVALTFSAPGKAGQRVNVVGGFATGDLAWGRQQLAGALDPQRIGSRSGTVLQQLARLKNELHELMGPKLKRLLYVIRDREDEIIFSRLEPFDADVVPA